ncbi:helix-turn-helix domain-containing protein [Bdellovibrio sp. ZAP7]|uniref:helix-turn-helix domain-containing protein n=1 Tax=Bdellovibrio sp. ZAP7 TaxID=2231053 RepID=UPI00143DD7C8|nr:helix-turn-helix transcriptional regulator [Bdellovibrio sp. ZAP7]
MKRNTSGTVFSMNLKTVLKEKKLTAKAVAKGAEISPSTFGQWINGAAPMDLQAVYRLARFLNVDFTWLLTGKFSQPVVPALQDFFTFADASELSGIYSIEVKKLKPK